MDVFSSQIYWQRMVQMAPQIRDWHGPISSLWKWLMHTIFLPELHAKPAKNDHIIISQSFQLFTVCVIYGSSEMQNSYLKKPFHIFKRELCMLLKCFKETEFALQ